MRRFLDPDHPMFRPVWVRAALVALCLGWALVEFSLGNVVWAVLFAGIGGYLIWAFFVAWSPPPEDGGD